MTEKDDEGKVISGFSARRAQQRKDAGEELYPRDSILSAADELTELLGRLNTHMRVEDVLVAVHLAERALYTVLRSSVGDSRTDEIRSRAVERAVREFNLTVEGVPDEARKFFRDDNEGDDE